MNKYKKTIRILKEIVSIIENDDFNISYLYFNKKYSCKDEYICELIYDIKCIGEKEESALKRVDIRFAPTGEFQELFLDNGLDEYYMRLSEEFDKIIRIR